MGPKDSKNNPIWYKGYVIDRGLVHNPNSNRHSMLDFLSLPEQTIAQGKTLEIGIGLGSGFKQAQAKGYDYIGVDLVPSYSINAARAAGIEHVVASLRNTYINLSREFPNKIVAVDAESALPFPDQSFDTVFSCHSLPMHANSVPQAVISILEMIRISKTLVAITGDMFDTQYQLGMTENPPLLNMRRLFVELSKLGINSTPKVHDISKTKSIHLQVGQANRDMLAKTAAIWAENEYRLFQG